MDYAQRPHRRQAGMDAGSTTSAASGMVSTNSAAGAAPQHGEIRVELLGQGRHDAHAETLGLANIEVLRQAIALVAHRTAPRSCRPRGNANPDLAARTVAIGILGRIGDQLGDDQGCRNGPVDRDLDAALRIDVDVAGRRPRPGPCRPGRYSRRDRAYRYRRPGTGARARGRSPGCASRLRPEAASACRRRCRPTAGAACSKPSIRLFLTRWFISLSSSWWRLSAAFEVALMALALDGHAEDVGRSLQEGEVVLDELVLRPAVHLEHAERAPVALQDDVHGAIDAVLAQEFRASGSALRSRDDWK